MHERIPRALEQARAEAITELNLRHQVDLVTAEVVRSLREARVRCILLKGPAITGWLYGKEESRPYRDTDLLVSPSSLPAAGLVLGDLGFEQMVDEGVVSEFAEPHAEVWSRAAMEVDLHWRLPGAGLDAEQAWRIVTARTEELRVADVPVEALAPPVRALHLALHAAHNGIGARQSTEDLARGVERLDLDVWRATARIASELDADAPLAVALRMTPAGQGLARALNLAPSDSERWQLWAAGAPPGALRLHAFLTTRGLKPKARMLARAIAPSPDYIRALYPSARSGRLALFRAYVRRPVPAIRSLFPAIRALVDARASARSAR